MANEGSAAKASAEDLSELEGKAQTGDSEAQLEIASLLLKKYRCGNAGWADAVRAVTWLRAAAEYGNPRAGAWLAGCYLEGHGVDKDHARAIEWYKKAAFQGDFSAQLSLGECYESGTGVVQNLTEAVRWYQMASNSQSEALCELGEDALESFFTRHKDLPLPTRVIQGTTDEDYIKTLTPQERHRFAIARYEEIVIGKKGQVAKTLAFFRTVDAFIKEHPGVSVEHPDFITLVNGNTPRTDKEWREIKSRLVADKASDLESCKLATADKEYIKGLVLDQQYVLVLAAHAWRVWAMRREFTRTLKNFRKTEKFTLENPDLKPEDSAFKQFVQENKREVDDQFWRKIETEVFDEATSKHQAMGIVGARPKIQSEAGDPQSIAIDKSHPHTLNPEHQPDQNTATLLTPDTSADNKKKFTLARCVGSGVWAAILCAFGVGIGGLGLLIAIPLMGLPWLLFEMNDKSEAGETLDAATGAMVLVGGAFISLFCALPVIVVFTLLRSFFR